MLSNKMLEIKILMDKKLSLFDYYTLTNDRNVLISYKGPVTDVIMSEISRDIRNKFAESPRISRKLFSVFIELAQNILYYSAEKVIFGGRRDSVGTIMVTTHDDFFYFECGNLVEQQYAGELLESCDKINSLSREELRKYKRETRNNPAGSRSKGAGIGLIQTALTSGNPLEVDFKKVNEQFSFFTLSVKVKQ